MVRIYVDQRIFDCPKGENLLAFLRRHGFGVSADCGGHGKCGKCRVWVNGCEELACNYIVNETVCVETGEIRHMRVESSYTPQINFGSRENGFGVAIDLGTTTIVVELIDLFTQETVGKAGFANPQRAFGADVICRVEKANNGALTELSRLVCDRIGSEIELLSAENKVDKAEIVKTVIAGNTVMIYLLLGFPCECLGAFPFKTDRKLDNPYMFCDIFKGSSIKCPVFIVPWFSAFVGGDVAAGLLTVDRAGGNFLFLDLGTNGEIALYADGRLYCTSTAAGPAFEGGNITYGAPGMAGAISGAKLQSDGRLTVKTIQGISPIGICGSGVLEITAELLKNNFIDETGLLADDFFDDGFPVEGEIVFTQKDIREVQLAKSAIRSGIEILLKTAGNPELQRVYLCGGFGKELNVDSAVTIGILPEKLKGLTTAPGNTSLAGAVRILTNNDIMTELEPVLTAEDINLAVHPDFNEYFTEYMSFE